MLSKEEIAKASFGSGSFGDAIRHMKAGGKARREKWPSKLYIALDNKREAIMKYSPSFSDGFVADILHADMLAKDWSSY